MPFPLGESCYGELLTVAAAFHEIPLERVDLPIQQVVCLVNQAKQRIGHHLGVGVFKPTTRGPTGSHGSAHAGYARARRRADIRGTER